MKLTKMLLTKLSNFVKTIFIITLYFCLFLGNLNGEESIDIWKNQNSELKKNNETKDINQEPKINILKKITRLNKLQSQRKKLPKLNLLSF